MIRPALAITGFSVICMLALPGSVQAKERHRPAARVAAERPLTVTKRSWLEPGNVVAVGSQNSYLSANTTLNQPTYQTYAPGRFGQSTLPGQFDLAFSNANPRGPQPAGIIFDDEP